MVKKEEIRMNQKQAITIFFLCLAGLVLVLSYFFFFFPTGPGPTSVSKAGANRKSPNPALRARKKILSYHNKVDKLLEIIKTPASLDPTGTREDHARFRALALHTLASMKTPKGQHAYIKLLSASSDPKIIIAALSALEPQKVTPKIKKIVKILILKTRNKFIRAKASLLYEKLSKE